MSDKTILWLDHFNQILNVIMNPMPRGFPGQLFVVSHTNPFEAALNWLQNLKDSHHVTEPSLIKFVNTEAA